MNRVKLAHLAALSLIAFLMAIGASCTNLLGIDTDHDPNPCTDDAGAESTQSQVCGKGACMVILPLCKGGLPVDCVGDSKAKQAEEACDGIDNNCNGGVDEGCPCMAGTTQPCYTGPVATRNVGLCKDGVQVCQNGIWSDCQGAVTPQPEACNGFDDDCNGQIDESCPCTPQHQQQCYGFAQATLGSDAGSPCHKGFQTCQADGTWGSCANQQGPAHEICNALDDDCNGMVDDGLTCECTQDKDCASQKCIMETGKCAPTPTCNDGIEQPANQETDVDCGGQICPKCANFKKCVVNSDCQSGYCLNKICQPPACNDGVKNGDETDQDCGGPNCMKCGVGKACALGSDCTSQICSPSSKTCQAPTCTDGIKNGSETDVDCGGGPCMQCCPACADTKQCLKNSDCQSGACTAGICQKPVCGDGVKNGDETDVDCGGSCAKKCDPGKSCVQGSDCTSQICSSSSKTCQVAGCSDGIKNGNETDVDCGGGQCPTCGVSKTCSSTADCQIASCQTPTIQINALSCSAGVCTSAGTTDCTPFQCSIQTGKCRTSCASDLDCAASAFCNASGACSPKQPNGQTCMAGNQCQSGFCVDNICCNNACSSACQACNVTGSVGACNNVPFGQVDTNPTCSGASACNGMGACLGTNGQSCTSPTQCLSGFCVDGVCCGSACTGSCQQCNSAGACVNVPAGNQDANASIPCTGTNACDGMGACVANNGQPCTLNSQCLSGNCVDGVCCNSACTGSCQACNVTGFGGICSNIPAGQQDTNAGTPCVGSSACNGIGSCLLTNGQACTNDTNCLSGHCADGVCCNSACTTACQSCNLAGTTGTCSNVSAGQQDAPGCTGSNSCSGTGVCVFTNGQACTSNTQCLSGNCVDGVCCNTTCNGQCQACTALKKGSGSDGTCGAMAAGTDPDTECSPYLCGTSGCLTHCTTDTDCASSSYCLMTTCVQKKANGLGCAAGHECTSGNCVDGVCCNSACSGTCQACNVTGSVGTCNNVPSAQPDPPSCTSPSACNGMGTCLFTNGASCATGGQCLSGNCVDGVCCNSTCTGTCSACNVPGNVGSCTSVPAGQPDLPGCGSPSACNGTGTCLLTNGSSCTQGTQCLSGNCVDGVCCNTSCTGTCLACNVTGSVGTCSNIPPGQQDSFPANACTGMSSCNGTGACVLNTGVACTMSSQCASGFCVDGFCCNNACTGTCQACNVPGSQGTCGNLIAGQQDTFPANACVAPSACDGMGTCVLSNGQACSLSSQCLSGNCVDGVCCSSACNGTCFACNVPGNLGTCAFIPAGQPDLAATTTCTSPSTCNGSGSCLLSNGQTCSTASQCASNLCVDGVCCSSACTGSCQACNVAGSLGTCTNVPSGQQDAPSCTGNTTCNGSGNCVLNNGQACTANSQCLSGACVDGVCCNTSCVGSCLACTAAKKGSGADGTCGAIASGSDPDKECTPFVCGGSGCLSHCTADTDCATSAYCLLTACVSKKAAGQACSAGNECTAGNCVDGVCCGSPTCPGCQACNVTGSLGSCTFVPSGQQDAPSCTAPNACNGAGSCQLLGGSACTQGSQCLSGNCVDGVCCNSACSSTCQACDVTGSVGTCTNVPSGQQDVPSCTAPNACNGASGAGSCVLTNGQACSTNSQCLSGNCVDGVCCNTSCTTTCQSCNVPGSVGTCSNLPSGQTDTYPTNACTGANACNGSGTCLFNNGQACSSAAQCLSGNCVDGVCCNTACTGTCQACSVSGSVGTCSNLPSGQQDNFPSNACTGGSACNGAGTCLQTNGASCTVGASCLSGNCVDGVCCSSTCAGTCQACNVSGSVGTCANVPAFQQDPGTCTSPNTCNGTGACLVNNGTTCSANAECASGFCVDGVCCNNACTGSCQACNVPGNLGTCTNAPAGQPDTNATVPCTAPKVCNGAGVCLPDLGQACSAPTGCASNFCVDGVCCNNSCTGVCTACSSAKKGSGADGTCGNVAIDTDPKSSCTATLYLCSGSGTCLTSCTSNGDCQGGAFCDMSHMPLPACTTKKGNGATCSSNAECSTGFCTDGVCCTTSSCGNCLSCNLNGNGTCSAVPQGQQDSPGCSGNNVCDGAGTCKSANGQSCTMGSTCASGNCVDNTCCGASSCPTCQTCATVGGTCANIPVGMQDNFPVGACTNGCDGSGNCLKSLGASCTADAQCVSGAFCTDGVCCGAAACNACNACNMPSMMGSCSPSGAGNDTTPPNTCSGTTTCNAAGSCLKALGQPCTMNNECASAQCVDGTCCSTSSCPTCQTCQSATGTCINIASGVQDTNPVGACTNGCDGNGNCLKSLGVSCSGNAQCASGNCVDNVCCSSSACAACNACNTSANMGNCAPAGLQTDTTAPNTCVTSCGTSPQICDSTGTCQSGPAFSCAPYTCSTTSTPQGCNTTCTTSAQCVGTGVSCVVPSGSSTGACLLATGQACSSSSQCATNNCAASGSDSGPATTCQSCVVTTCTTGFTCATTTNGGTCQGDPGSACSSTQQCKTNETCTSGGVCLGTTSPQYTSCGSNKECASNYCNPTGGGKCATPSGTNCGTGTLSGNFCLSASGTGCFANYQCLSNNCNAGSCNSGCGTCPSGTACIGTTCLGVPGTPCVVNGQCISGTCQSYASSPTTTSQSGFCQ